MKASNDSTAYAKISEEVSNLRTGARLNYTYNITRRTMSHTQLDIIISSSTTAELPRQKLSLDRIYNVESSQVTLYEKSPVDIHVAVCMKVFERKFEKEPMFREAILHPSSGFRIRKWTETYTNVVLLALLPAALMNCIRVNKERNSGIVEIMGSMGADLVDFYLSHTLFAYLYNIIVIMVLLLPNVLYFWKTTYSIVLINILLGLPAALISLVCSTFSKSCFTAVVWCFLVWMCLFLLSFVTPSLDSNNWRLIIYNLNPLIAYKSHFESIVIHHMRGSEETTLLLIVYPDVFTMLESFVLMITSCCLMILYLFLFELYSPEFLVFFVTKPKKVPSAKSEGFEMEKEEDWIDRAVTLDKVYKYWQSTKELAVTNVSFSAYYGQVSSGQKTERPMLFRSDDICRERDGFLNVLNSVKGPGNRFRGKEVGYCSQKIALFENLSVLEHLWFFYCLKTGKSDWKNDAESTANAVGLNDFLDKTASQLNGTMKRLLTLAIALVGGSPVVLMDEPLKGYDTHTKNLFRNILELKKGERCFLLATSSTETAEMIGDRIVMLCNGKILAAGSISFLKSEFGCSYVLNVILSREASHRQETISDIEHIIRKSVPSAELRVTCGKLIQFGFNSNVHDEHTGLLRGLEKSRDELGISEYYITLCTLMDVYRRLEVYDLKDDDEDEIEEEPRKKRDLCSLDKQFSVLLKKRLYFIPNFHCCFITITVPIVLVLFTAVSVNREGGDTHTWITNVSLGMYDYGRFIIFDPNNMTEKARHIIDGVLKRYSNLEILWTQSDNFCEFWPNDWPFVVGAVALGEEIGLSIIDEEHCTLRMPFPLLTSSEEGICDYWRCFHKSLYHTVEDAKDEIWIVPNIATFGYHTIIHELVEANWRSHWQRLYVNVGIEAESVNVVMLAIGIAHVFLLSAFVIIPVKEKSCFFKRQQILSGASVLTYWSAHFLFDTITAVIMVSFCLLLLATLHSSPSLLLSIAMYFYVVGGLPFVYFVSLFFRSSHQAFIVLTALTVSYPLLMIAFLSLEMQNMLLIVLPTFAFYVTLLSKSNTRSIESTLLVSIIIKFVVFTILLLLVESKPWHLISKQFLPVKSMRHFTNLKSTQEDSDDEESSTEESYVVRGVPFRIRPGESIGLLGDRQETIPMVTDIVSKQLTISCPCLTSYTELGFCSREDTLYPLLSPQRNLTVIAGIAGRPAIKHSKIVEAAFALGSSFDPTRNQA
ncbi:hypothetical protein GCK32_006258, partial [Trichostrongylus colubriformis]